MFKKDKKDGPVIEWIYIILGIAGICWGFSQWVF